MSEEAFNMSLRKFLKQVGVTSQREIEKFVRAGKAGSSPLRVRVELSAKDSDFRHVVEGKIDLP